MKTKQLNRWNGRMNPTGTDGHRISKIIRRAALALGLAALSPLGTAPARAAEPGAFAFTAISENAKDAKLTLGSSTSALLPAPEKQPGAPFAPQTVAPLPGTTFGWFSDSLAAALVQADAAKAGTSAAATGNPAGLAAVLSQRLRDAAIQAVNGATQQTATSGAPGTADQQASWKEMEAQIRKFVDLATSWCRPDANRWPESASTAKN